MATKNGTNGNDTLSGEGVNDVINGLDGNDLLLGLAGRDTLYGGAGDDTLDGGDGDDSMVGGDGNDTYYINSSNDRVVELAGGGNDTVRTTLNTILMQTMGDVENAIYDGTGNFTATGNALNNYIRGGAGNDSLSGEGGADTMEGLGGNDVYFVENAGDLVIEQAGGGRDGVNASIDYTLTDNVEILTLRSGAVRGTGNAEGNDINGQNLNNLLEGLAGDDSLRGNDGDDTLVGGEGNDTLRGDAGTDTAVFSGNYADYVITGTGTNRVVTDTVAGRDGVDTTFTVERLQFADRTIFTDGTNNAPIGRNDAFSGNEDTAISGNVLSNDSDFEGSALTAALASGPAHGSLVLNANGTFSYTPAANYNGADSFTYTVSDGSAVSGPVTVSLTVNPVNDAPTSGGNGAASGSEDAVAITGNVPAASDVDGNAVTYAVSGSTPAGLTFNSDGSYSFNPAAYQGLDDGETATVSFNYVATDGTATSAPATITITINGANDAPVSGGNATASGSEDDTAITGNVPAATDVDVETVTYAVSGSTPAGLTFNSDGSYAFNPAAYQGLDDGETATVSFNYVATDGTATSAPATVTITINGANDAPVSGGNATASGSEDALAITGNVPAATDVDVETVTYAVSGSTPAGLTFNSDGSYSFDPAAYQGLDDGETATVTFDYVATDGTATSAPATVTITINGANDAPVSGGNDAVSGSEDAVAITGNVPAATDVDVETLTYAVSGSTPAGLTFNSDGSYSFDPSAYQGLDDGETATVTFDYVATDGTATSAPATVTITINGANDAPVTGGNDAVSGSEDALAITGNVPAATDVDGESVTYAVSGSTPTGLTFNGDGSYSFDPSAYQGLDDGETATVTFDYVATDGTATSAPATVTITINGANDAPVSGGNDAVSGSEDAVAITGNVPAATDVDVETLTYAVSGSTPDGLTFNSDGSYSFDPSAYQGLDDGETATVSFDYVATDGTATSAPATITITINGANDAPVGVDDSYTGDEDTEITGNVLTNDTDVDGETLTAGLASGPAHGDLVLNADGSFTYTPDANYNGTDSFTYTVSDGTTTSAPVTVELTVTAVNDAPEAVNDTASVLEDGSTTGNVLNNDTDIETPSVLSVTDGNGTTAAVGSPISTAYGTLVLNSDGSFSYTADGSASDLLAPGATATDTFTYTVSDGNGGTDTATLTVTVTGVFDEKIGVYDDNGDFVGGFNDLESALAAAEDGYVLKLNSGEIDLEGAIKDGQVSITKDVTIEGHASGSTITAVTDIANAQLTTSAAMITVQSGATVAFKGFTIDGADQDGLNGSTQEGVAGGVQVATGILFNGGSGSLEGMTIQNIGSDVPLQPRGTGVAAWGGAQVTITDSVFQGNERIGVAAYDNGTVVSITDTDFAAKTADDAGYMIDTVHYGVQAWDADVTINGGTISGFDEVENGYESAGILAGSYETGATFTEVTVNGVTFTDNLNAISLGFQDEDKSALTLTGTNTVTGSVNGSIGLSANGDVTVTGVNTLTGDQAFVEWNGGPGNNVITGGGLYDTLTGGAGNDSISGGGDNDQLSGLAGDDTLVGGDGADVIDGGADTDTAVYASGVIARAGGHWTVTVGTGLDAVTETLIGVERVIIGSDVFLLVDKEGQDVGGFQTIQAAVNYANGGETVLIAPGSYVEDGRADPSNIYVSGLELDVNDLTLQGVTATGAYVNDDADVAATIRSNYSSADVTTIRVTGTGLTVNGLGFVTQPGIPGVNNGGSTKSLISVMADDATITNSTFGTGASYAIEINGPAIDNYTVSGNTIGGPIWILNGAGDGVGGDEVITNNTFSSTAANGAQSGIYVMGPRVASNVPASDYAPNTPSLPTTVSGNTFVDGLPVPLFVRTDSVATPGGLLTKAYVENFVANNLSGAGDTYAYVLDDVTGQPRLIPLTNDNQDAYVATSFQVLEQYQTTGVTVGSGSPLLRDTISEGDTVVVKTVGATNVTVHDNNLVIQATAGSDDLNLTLAETAAPGAPAGYTAPVSNITLADYAPGQGAQVDVTGNGLANSITGNSAANALSGGGGNDTVSGGGGNDTIDGGAGVDTASYTGAVTLAATGTGWTATSATGEGVDALSNVEIVNDSATGRVLLVGSGGFATIQEAINAAADGDTVLVYGNGSVYNESVLIDKAITLLSTDGTATINGQDGARQGAIEIAAGVNNVTIGDAGQGFTILGLNGNGLSEKAAVYLTGSHSGVVIEGNVITARGDLGLLTEYGATNTNLVIDGNTFDGQTFTGATPQASGSGAQFDPGNNVARQLVAINNNHANPTNANITFTNNTVSGTAGGVVGGVEYGNSLVTIDARNSVVSENTFTGYTNASAYDLRVRGPNNEVTDNEVDHTVNNSQGNGFFVDNKGVPATDYSGNVISGGPAGEGLANGTGLLGTPGADTINGGAGDDSMAGGLGNDVLNGGADTDTAFYAGARADYALTVTSNAGGFVTDITQVQDNNTANGDEGADSLSSIEVVKFSNATIDLTDAVQLFNVAGELVATFDTIKDAVAAASDGFTIRAKAGVYADAVTINKGVTILGVNQGVDGENHTGAETAITGAWTIATTSQVHIDGLAFVDSRPYTLTSGDNYVALTVLQYAAAGHIIENSVFERDAPAPAGFNPNAFAGSALQPTHRAIELAGVPTGTSVTIDDNLFTGPNTYAYAGDNWRSGVYSNGGAGTTNITGNTFENTRGAVNADNFSSTVNISGNEFNTVGTGIAVGVGSDVANVTTITGNTFANINDDISFQNLGTTVGFDATATNNHTVSASDPLLISGGSAGDKLVGTAGVDILNGNGGADTLQGGEGNDSLLGGAGSDTAVYADGLSGYNVTYTSAANGFITGATQVQDTNTAALNEGTDTLTGIEVLKFADATLDFTDTVQLFVGGNLVATYDSIQDAVDAAQDGDVIRLTGATYREQVVVDGKDITIVGAGAGNTIIEAPNAADLDVTAVQTGASRPNKVAVVTALNNAELELVGVTVDGRGQGAVPGLSGYDLVGVYGLNAEIDIENSRITGIREGGVSGPPSGNQRNTAVIVANTDGVARTFEITGSVVDNFQKNGFSLSGAGLTVNVDNNTVTGAGSISTTAQNGIQLSGGATGVISNNTISGIDYTPASVVGTSVLAFNANGLQVTGNTITGGSGAGDAGIYLVDSDAAVVTGNTLTNLEYALVDQGAFTTPVSHSGNTYTGNTVNVGLYASGSAPLTFSGTAGYDELVGGTGNDSLNGLGGSDYLEGGAGYDTLVSTNGQSADTLNGGAGFDTAVIDRSGSSLAYNLVLDVVGNVALSTTANVGQGLTHTLADGTQVVNVERLVFTGGSGNDTITGAAGGDANRTLLGDEVHGGGGNDVLTGGTGNDTLFGDEGNDTLLGGNDFDVLFGGDGNDSLDGGASNDTLWGGVGADTVLGGNGDDLLQGEAGDDNLQGGAGADTLIGGAGHDTLTGGAGADRFVLDSLNPADSDYIVDKGAADKIALSDAVFDAFTFNAVMSSETNGDLGDFGAGPQLIYDFDPVDSNGDAITGPGGMAIGILYYDANGGDASDAVEIARIQGGPGLTSADFLLV